MVQGFSVRLLVVRGWDLGSLAGRFELDLESPPLGRSGLCVIGDPTGAGKTTILDAISLALYDRVFTGERADPQALVRGGAEEARAEVEFVGRGGVRWRSTWSARPGSTRSAGVKLISLDTGMHGRLEEALGLDHSRFCRSILLQRRAFAELLEATDPAERAAQLERLAGPVLAGGVSVGYIPGERRRWAGRPARLSERDPLLLVRSAAENENIKQLRAVELAAERLQAVEEDAVEAEGACSQAFGGRDLRLARDELDLRLVTLANLRVIRVRAVAAQEDLNRARAQEESAREAIEIALAEEGAVQSWAAMLVANLEEAEQAAREARQALSLEQQRSLLRNGEPCSLCGSEQHPYAEEAPAFPRFALKLEERVHALRAEQAERREAAEGARVRAGLARANTIAARAAAISARERFEEQQEKWLDLGLELGWKLSQDLPPPWDPEAEPNLAYLEAATRQQLEIVRRLRDRLTQSRQGLAAAQQEYALARQRLAGTDRELTHARHQVELLEQQLINEQALCEAAQDLALESILECANAFLPTLAPGSRLRRSDDGGVLLEWVDLEVGEEPRTGVRSQGGERFLISLALALGLSSLASGDLRVESVFIEEGLGGYEANDPELVLASLQALQAAGQYVTLISRAANLTDHAGAGVRVVVEGHGETKLLVA